MRAVLSLCLLLAGCGGTVSASVRGTGGTSGYPAGEVCVELSAPVTEVGK